VSINLNISYYLGKKTTTNSPDLAENPLSLVTRSRRPNPTDGPDPVACFQSPAGERRRKRRTREREREREANKGKKKKEKKKRCNSDGFIDAI
jgi:hypothetical protein